MRALTEQYRRQKSWLKETLSVFPVLRRYLKEPNGNPTGPGQTRSTLVQIRSLFLSSQEVVVCRRAPEEGEDVQHEAIPECPAPCSHCDACGVTKQHVPCRTLTRIEHCALPPSGFLAAKSALSRASRAEASMTGRAGSARINR